VVRITKSAARVEREEVLRALRLVSWALPARMVWAAAVAGVGTVETAETAARAG